MLLGSSPPSLITLSYEKFLCEGLKGFLKKDTHKESIKIFKKFLNFDFPTLNVYAQIAIVIMSKKGDRIGKFKFKKICSVSEFINALTKILKCIDKILTQRKAMCIGGVSTFFIKEQYYCAFNFPDPYESLNNPKKNVAAQSVETAQAKGGNFPSNIT